MKQFYQVQPFSQTTLLAIPTGVIPDDADPKIKFSATEALSIERNIESFCGGRL